MLYSIKEVIGQAYFDALLEAQRRGLPEKAIASYAQSILERRRKELAQEIAAGRRTFVLVDGRPKEVTFNFVDGQRQDKGVHPMLRQMIDWSNGKTWQADPKVWRTGGYSINNEWVAALHVESGGPSLDERAQQQVPTTEAISKTTPEKLPLSVCRMLLGMAIAGYAYDPDAERNEATGAGDNSIYADLERFGLHVDEDTIRSHLIDARARLKYKKPTGR